MYVLFFYETIQFPDIACTDIVKIGLHRWTRVHGCVRLTVGRIAFILGVRESMRRVAALAS